MSIHGIRAKFTIPTYTSLKSNRSVIERFQNNIQMSPKKYSIATKMHVVCGKETKQKISSRNPHPPRFRHSFRFEEKHRTARLRISNMNRSLITSGKSEKKKLNNNRKPLFHARGHHQSFLKAAAYINQPILIH